MMGYPHPDPYVLVNFDEMGKVNLAFLELVSKRSLEWLHMPWCEGPSIGGIDVNMVFRNNVGSVKERSQQSSDTIPSLSS